MLFILRQLRRSFFQPGKFRTYIAYAVGEILLIVIGILIAVQIGDWKEEAKVAQQRSDLIENLTADFRTTLERAEACIEISEPKLESNSESFELLGGDLTGVSVETLKSIDTRLVVDFQPVLGAYRSAVSTGLIGLIQNSELSQLFIELEEEWALYQHLRQMHQDEVYTATGSRNRMAQMVGDENALHDRTNSTVSERFELSDEAFLEIISRKDYYALRIITHRISTSMFRRVGDIKEKAEAILDRLESL